MSLIDPNIGGIIGSTGSFASAVVQLSPLSDDQRSIPAPGYRLPVGILEEVAYETAFDHTDYTTIAAGEFSRAYARKLRTISFETMLIDGDYSWTNHIANLSVGQMTNALRGYCENGNTFELLIANNMPTLGAIHAEDDGTILRMPATLRSFKVTEKSGEPDTKYLSLSCSEYRRPVLTTKQRPGGTAKGPWSLTMEYREKGNDWRISCTPRDAEVSKLAKGKNDKKVTLLNIARALYGKDGNERVKDILKANKGLGEKWGATTPLEKNKWFKSGKKRILKVPQ